MGPTVLFDKSALEMLNADEAAIFDCLFMSILCPVFYAEVLADLSLPPEATSGRTPLKVVADLAKKSPILHAYPSPTHQEMCLNELLGMEVRMDGRPLLPGGRPVRHEGKVGMVFDGNPVMKAFSRWQKREFEELEHDYAQMWRSKLKNADFGQMAKLVRAALRIEARPRNMDEAWSLATSVLSTAGNYRVLKAAYTLLGLEERLWREVRERWQASGYRPLNEVAPYTCHCLLVDLFFYIATEKGLISSGRPSEKIDLAYLYYLPFARVFVSNDGLHGRVVKYFLGKKQAFVLGSELKEDMRKLDIYYSQLSSAERERGLMRVAAYPPEHGEYLTTRLWKQMGLLTRRPEEEEPRPDAAASAELVRRLKAMSTAPSEGPFSPSELADPSFLSIERNVPMWRGKWRILPPELESQAE
jgi:hypothetical protein